MIVAVAVAVGGGAGGACGGDAPTQGDVPVQIADSAGVRVVTYEGVPDAVAPFRLAGEPRYRHGGGPGDYIFQFVDAGRLFPDGSAVIADWYSEVVVLSPDGTTHEVLARVGEGPGEVIEPYALFVLGQDSVLVPDRRQSRLTLFAGGSVAHIVSLPRAAHFGVAGIGSRPVSCCSGIDTPTVPGSTSRRSGSPGT